MKIKKRGKLCIVQTIKSQAAIEFLATYAWAFMAIAVTMGALYYFGIFDFSKYLPQKCVFPLQFKCLDFSLKPTEVRLKLVNNLGEDICVTSIQITNDADPSVSCTPPSLTPVSCPQAYQPNELDWNYAEEKVLTFSNCGGGGYLSDERVELKVTMTFYAMNTPSKPLHVINGKVNGRVTS